jgi:alkylation response protein AidB-like acyl-CoA dehydrogenase
LTEFFKKNIPFNLGDDSNYLVASILGCEKFLFLLHTSMALSSLELWGTEEQRNYWIPKAQNYERIMTYAQTELGHGTYIRGLETVVTFDKETDEFIINSPTITSYKFWPGSCKL